MFFNDLPVDQGNYYASQFLPIYIAMTLTSALTDILMGILRCIFPIYEKA